MSPSPWPGTGGIWTTRAGWLEKRVGDVARPGWGEVEGPLGDNSCAVTERDMDEA